MKLSQDSNTLYLSNQVDSFKVSKRKYKIIVKHFPEAMIIISEGKIVFANKEASKIYGINCDTILGQSVINFIIPKYHEAFKKRVHQILNKESTSTLFDYELILHNKTIISVEVNSKFFKYMGMPAIESVIRNITKKKMELNKAAYIQTLSLQKNFPLPSKVSIESVFVPSKTVSGDFYHFYQASDDLLIGILVDVSGKGISAALNVSAINVLFQEAVLIYQDPLEIVNNLNLKVLTYLNETYIAICCFSLDFNSNIIKIVGAGVSKFLVVSNHTNAKIKTVPGAFLGMFKNSIFQEQLILFKTGDKFYFYTDGLDFIFDHSVIREKYIRKDSIKDLSEFLNNKIADIEGLMDDCTLLKLEIK